MPEKYTVELFETLVLSVIPPELLQEFTEEEKPLVSPADRRRSISHIPIGIDRTRLTEDFGDGLTRKYYIVPSDRQPTGTVILSRPQFTTEKFEVPGEKITLARENAEFIYNMDGDWEKAEIGLPTDGPLPEDDALAIYESIYLHTIRGNIIINKRDIIFDPVEANKGPSMQEEIEDVLAHLDDPQPPVEETAMRGLEEFESHLAVMKADEAIKVVQVDETNYLRIARRVDNTIQLVLFHKHPMTNIIRAKELFIFPQHIDAVEIRDKLLNLNASAEELRTPSAHVVRRSREE